MRRFVIAAGGLLGASPASSGKLRSGPSRDAASIPVAAALLVMEEKSMASSTAVRIVRPKKGHRECGTGVEGKRELLTTPRVPMDTVFKGEGGFQICRHESSQIFGEKLS